MQKPEWNIYRTGIDADASGGSHYIPNVDFKPSRLVESKVKHMVERYGWNREDYPSSIKADVPVEEFHYYKNRLWENSLGLHKPLGITCFREDYDLVNKLVSEYQETEERSVDDIVEAKFKKLYDTAYRVAAGTSIKRHAFLCGGAGIGKTYTISRGVQAGAKTRSWDIVYERGDIGSSMTNIISFLFANRTDKVIVLDDCDGFIKKSEQSIMNVLKAALDPSTPVVSVARTIRDKLNRDITKREGLVIDLSRIKKNVVSYYSKGQLLHEERATARATRRLLEALPRLSPEEMKSFSSALGAYGKPATPRKPETSKPATTDIKDAPMKAPISTKKPPVIEEDQLEVPDKFEFTSSVIFISNLKKDDVDAAIISRCNVLEFNLSQAEFMARIKQIFPSLLSDVTTLPKEYLEWAKSCVYRLLDACVTAANSKRKLGGKTVVINIPLEFRLFSDFVDDWIADAQEYADLHDEEDWDAIATAITPTYLFDSMIPRLAGIGGK